MLKKISIFLCKLGAHRLDWSIIESVDFERHDLQSYRGKLVKRIGVCRNCKHEEVESHIFRQPIFNSYGQHGYRVINRTYYDIEAR